MPVLWCGVAYAEPSVHNIGPGSTDTEGVECVQSALVSAARSGKIPEYTGSSVDGKYGPSTGKVVKAYQKKVGIPADGIVGPITGTLLYQEMQSDNKEVGNAQLVRCFGHLPTSDGLKGPTT